MNDIEFLQLVSKHWNDHCNQMVSVHMYMYSVCIYTCICIYVISEKAANH